MIYPHLSFWQDAGHSELPRPPRAASQTGLYEGILQAELVLGQLSADCSGNGICKVMPVGASGNQCTSVRTTLIRQSPQQLHIIFYRQNTCDCIHERVFDREKFVLEEVFLLPVWVIRELRLNEGVGIANGEYPLMHFGKYSLASFPLFSI